MSSIDCALKPPSSPSSSAGALGYADGVRGKIESRLQTAQRWVSTGIFWGGMVLVNALALVCVLWLLGIDIGISGSELSMPVFGVLLFAAILGSLLLNLRQRTRRVLQQMDQHPDRPMSHVCPACGRDPFGSSICCSSMNTSWSERDLDHHWTDYASIGFTADRISRGVNHTRVLKNPIERLLPVFFRQSLRTNTTLWCFSAVSVFSVIVGVIIFGTQNMTAIVSPFLMVSAFFFMTPFKSVLQPRCARCAHGLEPKGSFDSYELCPECGKYLYESGFVFFALPRRTKLLAASLNQPFLPLILVMFMVCVSPMVSGVFFQGSRLPFSPALPTSWLVALASTDDKPYPIWNELMVRTWTPEQSRDLFLELKELTSSHRDASARALRRHPAYMSFRSGTWPAPLSSTEIGELLGSDEVFHLNALEPDELGTPRAFQIACNVSGPTLDSFQTYLLYDTISLNDHRPVSQPLRPISLERVQQLSSSGSKPNYYDGVHEVEIMIPEPDCATVRAVVWVFEDPSIPLGTLTRDDRGELVFPPSTLWAGRIVLEHELVIQE